MSLLSWLTATQQSVRRVEAAAKVTVVLGNMAADLDSGVSSIVLAYHRANIEGVDDISRNTMLMKKCITLNCALFLSFHSLKSRHYYK